jgi:hypothetical protein
LATTFRRGDRVRIREAASVDGRRDFETHNPGLPVGTEGLVLEHAAAPGRGDAGERTVLVEWDEIGASTYISPHHLELARGRRTSAPIAGRSPRPPSR